MKKRSGILALAIAVVMILGSFTAVFAATGPATEATKEAIKGSGIQVLQKIQQGQGEATAETIAIRLHDTTVEGGYNLIDTATLAKMVEDKEDVVIIDTMPEAWYNAHHIPGAKCSIVGAMDAPEFKIRADEKTALYRTVKKAVGTKNVTKYKNKTTKKLISKAKYNKLSKKNKKKYKKVTVKQVNKDKTIVVYCGFVGCERSHQGAMYLVSKGFKNVYRYPGGISAWVDAGNDIEGSDVE